MQKGPFHAVLFWESLHCHGWIRDRLVPALKKGGAKGVSFNHTVFGGNSNARVSGARILNWAALQRRRGSLAYMSDEDYDALMAPLGEMATASNLGILRCHADLSL